MIGIAVFTLLGVLFLHYMRTGERDRSPVRANAPRTSLQRHKGKQKESIALEELVKLAPRDEQKPLITWDELDALKLKGWVALKGVVYDVRSGPQGQTTPTLGKDASCALATMQQSRLHERGTWRALTKGQLENLDDWVQLYQSRYPTVAYIKEEYGQKIE